MDKETINIIRKNEKKFTQTRILTRFVLWMTIALILFFQFKNIVELAKWLWNH